MSSPYMKAQKYFLKNPLSTVFYYSQTKGIFLNLNLSLPNNVVVLKMRPRELYKRKKKDNAN